MKASFYSLSFESGYDSSFSFLPPFLSSLMPFLTQVSIVFIPLHRLLILRYKEAETEGKLQYRDTLRENATAFFIK